MYDSSGLIVKTIKHFLVDMTKDRMKFGAVHLEVTHKDKSLWFYRDIIG